MVRAKGVEPSLPREPEPKSGASTNSATRASKKTLIKWVDSFLNTPPDTHLCCFLWNYYYM